MMRNNRLSNALRVGLALSLFVVLPACGGGGGGGGGVPNGTVDFTPAEWAFILANWDPATFPAVPNDTTNMFQGNAQAAIIGQQYFFDPRFSGVLTDAANNGGPLPSNGNVGDIGTISCARCHGPASGFTDGTPVSGASQGAAFTGRNAPTLLNAAYSPWMFWDGRKDSQWSQALGPTESPAEMNFNRVQLAMVIRNNYMTNSPVTVFANPAHDTVFGAFFTAEVTAILDPTQTYLETTYGFPGEGQPLDFATQGRPGDNTPPTAFANYDSMSAADQAAVDLIFVHWAKAIAAYEALLVSQNAPFDAWINLAKTQGPGAGGNFGLNATISDSAKQGLRTFFGSGQCTVCHNGHLFTDQAFHNIGVRNDQGAPTMDPDNGRTDGIPQVLADPFNSDGAFSDDTGTGKLTGLTPVASDLGAFKTPTLRDIANTLPFMHTGRITTLQNVMIFYNNQGDPGGTFQGTNELVALGPINLTGTQIIELVDFMNTLNGAALPANLTTAPTLPN